MPDLFVVAVISAKDGASDVVREALEKLVPPTRAEEGCISYDLYESQSVPGAYVTVEKWRTQDDLDAHMQTPHIAAALSAAADAFGAPPAIHALKPIIVG